MYTCTSVCMCSCVHAYMTVDPGETFNCVLASSLTWLVGQGQVGSWGTDQWWQRRGLGPFPGSQDSPLIAPVTTELLDISLNLSSHFTLLQAAPAVLRPSPRPPRAGRAGFLTQLCIPQGLALGQLQSQQRNITLTPRLTLPSS